MAIVDEFRDEIEQEKQELTEAERNRRERGLSIEWFKYPRTDIEVFYDSCAVLYRIEGKIYVVPRPRYAFIERDPFEIKPALADWGQRDPVDEWIERAKRHLGG